MSDSEYMNQLVRQNAGLPCQHCGSNFGHTVRCPLLNREVAESAYFRPERYKAEQLAPYQHELNGNGTACSDSCPCCIWLDLQELIAKRKTIQKTPDVVELEKLWELKDERS